MNNISKRLFLFKEDVSKWCILVHALMQEIVKFLFCIVRIECIIQSLSNIKKTFERP
jgi:hypothetical protein